MTAALPRLLAALALAVALGFASAAPSPAQVPAPPRTACGIELSRGLSTSPGGPVCGTDEGDDLNWAGEGEPLSFFGENGHDTVEGSRYGDRVVGGPGNDELHGGRGADLMDGGDDSDTVFGGPGPDRIVERRFGVRERFYGGPGDDQIAGGRGSDTLFGGTGDDVLLGGAGSDVLWGGPGDDALFGGPNRDVFHCGPGDDVVYRVFRRGPRERSAVARRDGRLARGHGCERVVNVDPTADFPLRDVLGTNGRDELAGGPGNDLLQGKAASDRLFGGAGDDELEGDGATRQGNDLLMGGAGNDRLAGRRGDDLLYGDARSPTAGPPGNDELAGGAGRDLLVGGPGSDLIQGAYDGDRILAGGGNDVITLLGGDTSDPFGRVHVDCGRGRDRVVVNPHRRATLRRCETVAEQFHEADHGFLLRPSPEVYFRGFAGGDLSAVVASLSRASRAGRSAQQPSVPAAGGPPPPPAPAEPAGNSGAPSLDAAGNRVAFSSDAPNLLPRDVNAERTDALVRDVVAGATLLADDRGGGVPAIRGGRLGRTPGGALSADGRLVVYTSNSRDLYRSIHAHTVFVADLATGRSRPACRPGNADSANPVVSADGRFVAFESRATNLVGGDENQHTDVYRCDLHTGALERVSRPLRDHPDVAGSSLQPSISGDGRHVAFISDAGGIVRGDGTRSGVYLRDMASGQTRVVDAAPGATTSNGIGRNPRISADSRQVLFDSDATDLPGGERNGRTVDVFRADLAAGTVELVTRAGDGASANGDSTAEALSFDGARAVFSSTASNLVDGDANGASDVFAADAGGGPARRVSLGAGGGELPGPSSGGAISGDGRIAAFGSRSTAVTGAGAASGRSQVYRRDLESGGVDPVALGLNLPPRSLLAEPTGTMERRFARLVSGTAADNGDVRSVEVAVGLRQGGGCRWLEANGRLGRPDSCAAPRFLPANLESGIRFSLRIRSLLPRGSYVLRSRATDDAGQVEAERLGDNSRTFRLR